jgi:histidine triad (HIT) family protein
MSNCIFCKFISGEVPTFKIHETENIFVFLSLEGHPLILPKKHVKDIYDLDSETGSAVMEEAIKIAKAVKQSLQCEGVNLLQNNEAAAGQEVFHFHLHIKPRWKNDNISLHWDTTTLSEDIRASTTEKIKEALA